MYRLSYLRICRLPFYILFLNREVLIKVSDPLKVDIAAIKDPLQHVVAKVWITLAVKLKRDPRYIHGNISELL